MPKDEEKTSHWIHLLFRGDVRDQEVNKSDKYLDEFVKKNLVAATIPILEFKFMNLEELFRLLRVEFDEQADAINGLIITSPRVVEAIEKAIETNELKQSILGKFNPDYVFVVGDKTAQECESRLGIKCNPSSAQTGNSLSLADYIKTFCCNSLLPINLLYPKGSLADNLIEDSLACENKIELKSIIVYETNSIGNLDGICRKAIQRLEIPAGQPNLIINMIYFSPSGVDSYLKMGQDSLLDQLKSHFPNSDIEFKYSSIGKTTEAALLRNNIQVHCVSERPNPTSIIECISKRYS